ncbi:conserved hypothetical protein [Methylococcus capsulatus str. Bath]|uniref:DUF3422 domain-containing protein n=1 Tax=Methylococcus capsulatus (strain ATCC 33009 / NCIMB 11132 / Bath) TaxID=243233 RepID=Q604H3_METCA|nr:DUF3422 domain-containing protein [Methylococcus capsulatus]AAU91350.1 conserved hypothetical protein [Methylococcus capsulatus str. Bath]
MLPTHSHADRRELNDEVHARAYENLFAPEQVSQLIMLVTPEDRANEAAHIAKLCRAWRVSAPEAGGQIYFDNGEVRVQIERHQEFTRYRFSRRVDGVGSFENSLCNALPNDWLGKLPGALLVAAHVELVPHQDESRFRSEEDLSRVFEGNRVIGAKIAGGAGRAYTDFRIHADGYSRFLVVDESLSPGQAGRTVQRLLEIETYRMLALMAFPEARKLIPRLRAADHELLRLTACLARDGGETDEVIQAELSQLAAHVENLLSASYSRFDASRAYHAIVNTRLEQLREQRIPGFPTFTEYLTRRLAPAMQTIVAVAHGLEQLSRRIANANQLLTTRIDVKLAQQNQSLLQSMNRRAKLQLRLQQTVEGLSAVAITYYGVSLANELFKGLKAAGLHFINVEFMTGLSVPWVGYMVYRGLCRFRETIEQDELSEPK